MDFRVGPSFAGSGRRAIYDHVTEKGGFPPPPPPFLHLLNPPFTPPQTRNRYARKLELGEVQKPLFVSGKIKGGRVKKPGVGSRKRREVE